MAGYQGIVERITRYTFTIDDLTQHIITSKVFKHFHDCQIIVHHKGETNTSSCTYRKFEKIKVMKNPISEFNHLFEGLKKKKIFDASNFQRTPLNIVGKFLANTIELQSHHVLIVISKGSFLPPTNLEIGLFYQTTNALKPFLKQLLKKENKEDKIYHNFICLKHLPAGIEVRDQKNQMIFKNDYRLLHLHETDFKVIPIDRYHKLHLYSGENEDLIEDFNHYERIQLLGGLLNTLSHELNNPIFGMKLACDLLKLEIQDKDSQELLENIAKNLKHSQTILNDFSSLYQDSTQIISLKDIIDDTLKMAESEIRTINKKVRYHSNKKMMKIKTNPTWVSQILFNLILNSSQALKEDHGPHRGAMITIDVYKTGHYCEIHFSDNGPGIPPPPGGPQNISALFHHKGPGNRAWTRHLSKSHKKTWGAVNIKRKRCLGGLFFPHSPSNNMNILLVEDEPLIQKSLAKLLSRRGATITGVSTGKEAMALISQGGQDRIICDLMLQDVTGFDIIEDSKRFFDLKEIAERFVIITAYNSPQVLGKAKEYQCPVIQKPFENLDEALKIMLFSTAYDGEKIPKNYPCPQTQNSGTT